MSRRGLAGMRALHEEIGPLLRSLTPHEWVATSACAGWRVQEVVAHMSATMKMIVDPDPMPPLPEGATPPGAEEVAELMVAPRKDWSAESVLAEFERYREGFLGFLAAVQEEPAASAMADLGDLGSHPTHIFSDVFCFDHYCHLAFDICQPHGPVDRAAPSANPDVLGPAVDWMLAGLPAMCARDLGVLTAPIALVLDGPGGGEWVLHPATGDALINVTEGPASGTVAATVRSTAHDFISWGTKRSDWRATATVDGDASYAATVLDVVNVI
jgi:hypothetical protein